jgi:hypothetical protein
VKLKAGNKEETAYTLIYKYNIKREKRLIYAQN